jgi:hypothetical protein
MRRTGHVLDGTAVEGTSDRYRDMFKLLTGKVQARVYTTTRIMTAHRPSGITSGTEFSVPTTR